VTRRIHVFGASVLLAIACGPSGTGPSSQVKPALQPEQRSPCSPISDVAGHRLVWCPAFGPTCASQAACDFIDPSGETRGPADPPNPASTKITRITVFLRGNCEDIADVVDVVVEGASGRHEGVLTPGGSGFVSDVSPGAHVIEGRSRSGLEWEPFSRSVPEQGLVQRLTCR